jgi:hypothetical protein
MSVSGPACVKTRTSGEGAELFSPFASFDGDCQCCCFSIQRNLDKISTRKFDVGVFTQAGSFSDLGTHGAQVRSSPNSGNGKAAPGPNVSSRTPTARTSQQFPDRYGLWAIRGPGRLGCGCRAATLDHHAPLDDCRQSRAGQRKSSDWASHLPNHLSARQLHFPPAPKFHDASAGLESCRTLLAISGSQNLHANIPYRSPCMERYGILADCVWLKPGMFDLTLNGRRITDAGQGGNKIAESCGRPPSMARLTVQ